MTAVWPFNPLIEVSETLEWATDIMQSRDSEDAISLRVPRQSFSYSYFFTDAQAAVADGLYRSNPLGEWYVPVWPDCSFVSGISSTDTNLVVDTFADYRVDGLALVISDDATYSVVTVSAVNTGSIDIADPVGDDYATALVMPLRTGVAPGGYATSRTRPGKHEASILFHIQDHDEFPATTYDQHDGIDVLTEPSIVVGGLDQVLVQPNQIIDGALGNFAIEASRDVMRGRHSAFFMDHTMEERWARKQWFYHINGRQGLFWLPNWSIDLVALTNVTVLGNSVTVSPVLPDIADYVGKHVRIGDGTNWIYREITSANLNVANHRLYFSPAGVDIDAEEVMICFIHRVRLDTDTVTFSHKGGKRSEVRLTIIEV